jgi:hypothetical protein
MDNSLVVGGSVFDSEHVFDLDAANSLNQYGFMPTHPGHNIDQTPIIDYSSFMPALLPDSQPSML